MTAEIVVLNKMAVALAADSKVTIGGDGQEKTYDSVNKLFTLTKCHPIGVMIYGNAEFMGIPWETIIKIYRDQKKGGAEETVKAWSEDFIGFISEFKRFETNEIEQNVEAVLYAHFLDIRERVSHRFLQEEAADIEEITVDEINKLLEKARDRPFWLIEERHDALKSKYKELIGNLVESFLKGYDSRQDEMSGMLTILACELLTRAIFSPISSGIVIAGFGSKEIFPSVVCRRFYRQRKQVPIKRGLSSFR